MSVHTRYHDPLDVIASDSRPAITMSAVVAAAMLETLTAKDVIAGGCWLCTPTVWQMFSRPWRSEEDPAGSQLIGSVYVVYSTPTSYEVTIHRATVTPYGRALGWTPEMVCADAVATAGLSLTDFGRIDVPNVMR